MSAPKLRIACRRHDWSNALFDGRINEPSMAFLPDGHLELEQLLGEQPSVDFMECGLVNYYRARSQGVPVVALPIFLRAAFRHSYIFVNTRSGIERPADLEGKRVGTRYGMTANVWARALLQHQYGVRLEKIHWLNAEPGAPPYTLPPGTVLEPVADGVDVRELLVDGAIDALVHPDVIPTTLMARGTVKRLFANAPEEERTYYRTTKVIPVMNVITVRERDLTQHPQTVAAVFDVFCRAKCLGIEAMQDVRDSGLVWYQASLEAQIDLLGADPVPYSVEKMAPTIDAFVEHGLEQGVFDRRLSRKDLFWEPSKSSTSA